jgi:hypothetical protein
MFSKDQDTVYTNTLSMEVVAVYSASGEPADLLEWL